MSLRRSLVALSQVLMRRKFDSHGRIENVASCGGRFFKFKGKVDLTTWSNTGHYFSHEQSSEPRHSLLSQLTMPLLLPLAKVATEPDVLFHVLRNKPKLVGCAGDSKKRKRNDE
jgi:hypothetical protein